MNQGAFQPASSIDIARKIIESMEAQSEYACLNNGQHIYIGKRCLNPGPHYIDCHSRTADPREWCATCSEFARKIGETVQ